MYRVAVVLLLAFTWPVQSARILAIEPFPSKSHMVVFSSLTSELARRGHELVVVSTYPLSKPMANYTDIDIMPAMKAQFDEMVNDKLYQMNEISIIYTTTTLWGLGLMATEKVMKLPQVLALLDDKRGFDLVMVEAFMNEAVYGFADYFKAPLVIVCPFGGFHFLNYGFGNPATPSYIPNGMFDFSDKMNFLQRLANTAYNLYWDIGHYLYYLPRQEAIRKEVFGNGLNIWELVTYPSLMLLNNHFSMNYPRPLVPNIVEVGGMHVSRTPKKLPADIQKFIDEAKDGVIYFSMGSNLRSDQMPAERRAALLAAFAELPQRVLWKWESDTLPGKPDNVMLGKWMPQQDILAHPNVKLFITHGGLLSAQEAIFNSVPIIGIPVFGDQSLNMRKAELAGYGLTVELKNVTKQSMLWALNKVLHEPSYRQEARRRSSIYRDQPESPMERAVFWTEHVLRQEGAPHLRSAAINLSWYQLYLLDVIAFVLAIITIFVLVVKKLLKMCCGSSKAKSTNTKSDRAKKKQ